MDDHADDRTAASGAATGAGETPAWDSSRPDWVYDGRYPFESHLFETEAGRVHYVDEGDATDPPVVFLHGNPTWSFLFRKQIRRLRDDYRCIAPDYLGFGLSDKPREFQYRPEDHARTVERLVAHLDLRNPTLVCHDWGGPIGLDCATRDPDGVGGLVLSNTWAWPLDHHPALRRFGAAMGGLAGQVAIEAFGLFALVAMPALYADRSRLTPEIHRAYLRPHTEPADRRSVRTLAGSLADRDGWLARLWARRDAVRDVPTLLAWGTRDPAFGGAVGRWRRLRPDARVVEFADCGHFVPEEKGAELAAEIRAFLGADVDAGE